MGENRFAFANRNSEKSGRKKEKRRRAARNPSQRKRLGWQKSKKIIFTLFNKKNLRTKSGGSDKLIYNEKIINSL